MHGFRKGSHDLTKEVNRNIVLNIIKSRGPISRAETANLSGLSPATISGLTTGLIESGLVHEIGEGKSTGGRRPVLLRLNHQAGFVVGVKLMEHAVTIALTDLDARVLHHRVTPLEHPTTSMWKSDAVIQTVITAIEHSIEQNAIDHQRMLGIGVGMGGLVNSKSGICRYSPFFGWRDVQIAKPISEHFGLPVHLENDVNTLTIAEQWFGRGHGVDHFIVVTVGRGIGAGIVVNGRLHRGILDGAGEIGHMVMPLDDKPNEADPLCECGRKGCLESLASDPAILNQVKAAISAKESTTLTTVEPLTLEAIAAAANDGDELAQRLLGKAGRWLGVGIAGLINVLNPQLVIISGEGAQAGKWRFDPMRKALSEYAFHGLADDLDIIIDPLGDETWARGAACVVLGELFQSPILAQS